MTLRIEPRRGVSGRARLLAPVMAIVLTLAMGAVLFALLGYPPIASLHAFFIAPLSSTYGITELLVKAVPLIIIAAGLAIGFRANVWNIGAEGQLTIGAIAAAGVGLFAPEGLSPILLPLMFLAGVLGGMLWAAIPAVLRTRLNTSETLVTLMLTYIAQLLLSFLVRGPWRDPHGFNFPQTAMVPPGGLLEPLAPAYRVTGSVWFALVALAVLWLVTAFSFEGYKLGVGGRAPRAARYAGFSQHGAIWVGLLAGGGAAGIAGFYELAGPLGQLSPVISPGYGFAAIIVAFVGRLSAPGILLSGLFLALTYVGGESLQMSHGIPAPIAEVFQGMLLFLLLASEFFVSYRVGLVRKGTS